MLAIVKFPVLGQNPTLRLQTLIKRGVGKRGHDRESRQINAGLHRKFSSLVKDIRFVVIEAEDKTTLKRNPMLVQTLHDPQIFIGSVKSFVALSEILRRDRFQPHQQAFTTAPRSDFE